MTKFDPVEYKKRSIETWNEVAPRYHERWVSKNKGPFKSTPKLLSLTKIKSGDFVLDLACGTGAVTKKISKIVGRKGLVVGVDTSFKAIQIAKKWNIKCKNTNFIISDAEKIHYKKIFDAVTCQYALFFFQDSQQVLHNLKECLKKNGRISFVVHGKKNSVPYFSCILNAITKFIPDYIPTGSPSLDRFGNRKSLKNEIIKAGFKKIKIYEYIFSYSPGTFTDYWNNYLRYIAKPLKIKIKALSNKEKEQLKKLIRKNIQKYIKKNGKIVFPWKILIVTAMNS